MQVGAMETISGGDYNTQVPVVSNDEFGLIAAKTNEMVNGLKEREMCEVSFGKFVTPEVSEKILKGELSPEGESNEVTILFCDLRGYTPFVERRDPKDVVKFLQSKRATVLRQLKKQMEEASANRDYESAGMYRDRIKLIESLAKRGSVDENVQPEVFAGDPSEAMERLRSILKAEQPIRIIEGFDIAHIAGSETVGSMVQFIDGRPFKDGYRRFRIKNVKGVDDYASLKEVVGRRYKRAIAGEVLWPDVVLIDGGIGQLHAAEQAFEEMKAPVPLLLSIAKKEELVFVRGSEKPLNLKASDPARKLLQYVRDEAHRFAQHYHHILRRKKTLNEK